MNTATKQLITALVLLVLVGVIIFISSRTSDTASFVENQNYQSQDSDSMTESVSINKPLTTSQKEIMDEQTTQAIITTSQGVITLELYSELAPQTVENFAKLAQEGFYDGTRFHRVIDGFMIQAGDPLSRDEDAQDRWGTGGPGYTFNDEIHEQNQNMTGTISMANAGPNTNGSQFFINVADNNFLDTKHTVFGEVVSGMDVVQKISTVETDGRDRPVEDVIIESIQVSNQ